MNNKFIFRGSLLLNGLFILFFLFIGIRFKEQILQKFFDKQQKKIVMYGDSHVKLGKWSNLLNRNDIKNSGLGGATTGDLVQLVHERVIAYKPEKCFIEVGINDIVLNVPLHLIKYNYTELIDTLLANNITPVIQSTLYQENNPQNKMLVDSINNFLADYCASHQLYYLDLNSKLSTNQGLKPEYSLDGTHITERAYETWSNELNLYLRKIENSNTNSTTLK